MQLPNRRNPLSTTTSDQILERLHAWGVRRVFAHAKFTGEVGVCMATSGPGAIHLLNGLYDAKADHQPVVGTRHSHSRSMT